MAHGSRERLVLLMYVNKHPMDSKFNRRLTPNNPDMSVFSHKCWGLIPPYTHVNGTYPIDGGFISPEIKVVNLAMLNFNNSLGDHRLLILDMSTWSLVQIQGLPTSEQATSHITARLHCQIQPNNMGTVQNTPNQRETQRSG
jgi:hypothetical protein